MIRDTVSDGLRCVWHVVGVLYITVNTDFESDLASWYPRSCSLWSLPVDTVAKSLVLRSCPTVPSFLNFQTADLSKIAICGDQDTSILSALNKVPRTFPTIALAGPGLAVLKRVDVPRASAAAAPWKLRQAPSAKEEGWTFHLGPFCPVPCGREASSPRPFTPSSNNYLGHTYQARFEVLRNMIVTNPCPWSYCSVRETEDK